MRILRRGSNFYRFLFLPNLVLKLNLNIPKRVRVEAAYRSKTLAYCGSNPRFETSGPAEFHHENGVIENRVFNPLRFCETYFGPLSLVGKSGFELQFKRDLLFLSLVRFLIIMRVGGCVLVKGVSCKIQCYAQRSKNYPMILAVTIHMAFKTSRPRKAYFLVKTLSKTRFFSWLLILGKFATFSSKVGHGVGWALNVKMSFFHLLPELERRGKFIFKNKFPKTRNAKILFKRFQHSKNLRIHILFFKF